MKGGLHRGCRAPARRFELAHEEPSSSTRSARFVGNQVKRCVCSRSGSSRALVALRLSSGCRVWRRPSAVRQRVEEGFFARSLLPLNVLSMYLPPLRERRDDIPLLVRQFVKDYSAQHDRPFHGISADAMQILMTYSWPGNVRELRNLVESMVVLAPGREITDEDIPHEIREGGGARFLPVRVGPMLRESLRADGREMEFIVRSLVELKLQIEELRARVNDVSHGARLASDATDTVMATNGDYAAERVPLQTRSSAGKQGAVTYNCAGMTMAEIEKLHYAALAERRAPVKARRCWGLGTADVRNFGLWNSGSLISLD